MFPDATMPVRYGDLVTLLSLVYRSSVEKKHSSVVYFFSVHSLKIKNGEFCTRQILPLCLRTCYSSLETVEVIMFMSMSLSGYVSPGPDYVP